MQMPDESHIRDGLNEEQLASATAGDSPLLIVAGPGTGKTLTIVRRTAFLVSQGLSPDRILAVTFTTRAAFEMRVRISKFLGSRSLPFIGTFHLLGLRIMRECGLPDVGILDREGQHALLMKTMGLSGQKARLTAERISRAKNLLLEPEDDLADAYSRYHSALDGLNKSDLDDLILKPIRLLLKGPNNGPYDWFDHIIVDEFQDINPAQYRLIRLLSRDGRISAVGDADQAIYAFRGADIENFLNFERDLPGARTVRLTLNYRSTGRIVNAAYGMIKNNPKRVDTSLSAFKEAGSHITVINAHDERGEAKTIVSEIERRIGGTSHLNMLTGPSSLETSGGYSFSDFAVLFRTNAQTKAIEDAFISSGIPYQVIGARRSRRRNEMAALVDLMRARLSAIKDGAEAPLSFGLFIESTLAYAKPEDAALIRAIAVQYDQSGPAGEIIRFIDELALMTPADDFDPRAEAVTLATLHMSKGLEFRAVFIAGVEDGIIPYTHGKGETDIEEERRLFYVGMTRAKEELFLLHSRRRFLYGSSLEQSPSPFLTEIPAEHIERRQLKEDHRRKKEKQIGLF